jgi:transposase
MKPKEIFIPTETEVRCAYHEGEEAVVSLFQRVTETISRLVDRIQALEDRLEMNSNNSHKPPSSDGFSKPSPKSRRKRHKRKSGGQPGHAGNTLELTANPDRIIPHAVLRCRSLIYLLKLRSVH